MGFFSKLFEKKECAICGGEIGILGNRKLSDGNMCKKCAAKLSPWFSDRRSSTVDEINEQLKYREKNQEALEGFHPVKSFGDRYMMFVEEENSIPTRFVVSNGEDYKAENADLISFKNVSGCEIDIDETHYEIKRKNEENQEVSYDPPRYRYNYNFKVELLIENNPYFDNISFKLNRSTVEVVTEGMNNGRFLSGKAFDPSYNTEWREYKKLCDEVKKTVECGRAGKPNLSLEETVQQTLGMLAEQMAAAKSAQQAVQAPAELAGPKFCPNCGSPAAGMKFCGNCGSKL